MARSMLIALAFAPTAQALHMAPVFTTARQAPAARAAVDSLVSPVIRQLTTAAALPTSPVHGTSHDTSPTMPGMQTVINSLAGLAPGQVRVLGRVSHHLFHALLVIGTVALGKGFIMAFILSPLVTVNRRTYDDEAKRNVLIAVTSVCLVFWFGNMERTLSAFSASLTGILLNAVTAEAFMVGLSLMASFFHRTMHTNRHLRPFHDVHHSIKDVGAELYGHHHSLVDYCLVYMAPAAVLVVAQMLVSGFRPRLLFASINALDTYFKHTLFLHSPVPTRMVPFIFFTDPSIYANHAAHHANGGSNFNGPSYDLCFQSLVPLRWRSKKMHSRS
jgi:sterol desaturase/sphingolipid hydroxylase (fatty acid hydroxylase superfamily)